MTSQDIEKRAVAEIEKYITACKDLAPYLLTNDRTPVWDGDIYVYEPQEGDEKLNHTVDKLIRRIPAQVKGTESKAFTEQISYNLETKYIDAFLGDGALIFFVVQVNAINARVFYRMFTVDELKQLKDEAGEKASKSFHLNEYLTESNYESFNDRLVEFANKMPQQGDKSKVVKLDESQSISQLLQANQQIKKAILNRAIINESDIYKLYQTHSFGWIDKVIALYRDTIDGTEEYFERNEYARWILMYATFLHNVRCYHLIGSRFDSALKLYRELYDQDPQNYACSFAEALINIGYFYKDIYKYAEAEKSFVEAFSIYRNQKDKKNPRISTILNNLGTVYQACNMQNEAKSCFIQSINLLFELSESNPNFYDQDIAMSAYNLGNLYLQSNHYDEAEKYLSLALKAFRETNNDPVENNNYVANTLNLLSFIHTSQKKYVEAEKELKEALSIVKEMAENTPSVYLPEVARILNTLGFLKNSMQLDDEAFSSWQESYSIYYELSKQNPSISGSSAVCVGSVIGSK